MALQRISYQDREAWLTGRQRQGIGASEAAAICGFSPWQTRTELWEIHTGRKTPKDIGGNADVQRGNRMEGAIRDFFATAHQEFAISHHPYDILYQENRPWMFATLDGQLTDIKGRSGILEIKTAAPNGKAGWAEWDGKIPQHYYAQILHQLLATGFDFAILFAALYGRDGDITLKAPYVFERSECEADMGWVLKQEEDFWESVQTGKRPGVPIRF